jgi:hypothetical protein
VLRDLWGKIRTEALVEYKSVKKPEPVSTGDLTRLMGYGCQYATLCRERVPHSTDLPLVLVTARPTAPLDAELAYFDAQLGTSQGGYAPITGLSFPAWAVFLDEVSEAERDELVGLFGHGEPKDLSVHQWMLSHMYAQEGVMAEVDIKSLEGFEELLMEVFRQTPPEVQEKFLQGLDPEQRLQGLDPEQRRRLRQLLDEEDEEG